MYKCAQEIEEEAKIIPSPAEEVVPVDSCFNCFLRGKQIESSASGAESGDAKKKSRRSTALDAAMLHTESLICCTKCPKKCEYR